MTDQNESRPNLSVSYDEGGIALWIQARPGGLTAPLLLTVDQVHTLLCALHAAIDDRDGLITQIDNIRDADPDDFHGA